MNALIFIKGIETDKFAHLFLEPSCTHNLEGESGVFTTKNFPEDYDVFSNCTWNITVQEGSRVKLTFHLLNVSTLILAYFCVKRKFNRYFHTFSLLGGA